MRTHSFFMILLFASKCWPLLSHQNPPKPSTPSGFETAIQIQERQASKNSELDRTVRLGQKFWLVPSLKSPLSKRISFRKNPAPIPFHRYWLKSEPVTTGNEEIYPTTTIAFTVLGAAPYSKETGYTGDSDFYKVQFDDKSIAFVYMSAMNKSISSWTVEKIKPIDFMGDIKIENLPVSHSEGRLSSYDECFYMQDPDILVAKAKELKETNDKLIRAQAEASNKEFNEQIAGLKRAAASRARRGPVNIGMTKLQVRASSWGEPLKIIKEIRKHVDYEKWVYDTDRFLYFVNGIVTSINISE